MPSLMPNISDPQLYVVVDDDFLSLNTAATNGLWASVNDGATGTLALSTSLGAGGWINIPSAGADNDYQLLASASKPFKFASRKPLFFDCSITLTEAATNVANWVVGLSSVTTSGFLANDGAGPPGTYDGAVFFKVDGTMTVQFETSAATSQVTNASVATFTSAATYRLGFHFNPNDGTTGIITPYVNGVAYAPHSIALASLGLMNAIVGVKAGSASAETLSVDYFRCYAVR